MEIKDGKPVVDVKTRKAWRQWLQKHHDKEKSVWLVMQDKKSKTPGIAYNDVMEEALCFGWIDSLAKKRDDESFYLTFTPRKAKSNWSQPNRERAAKMIAEGLMMPAGQETIDTAKATGHWEREDE